MSTQPGSVTFHEIPPGQIIVEAIYQNMMYGRVTTTMPEDDHTVTVQLVEGIKFFVFEQYTAGQQNRIPIAGVTVEILQGQTVIATLTTDQNGIAGPILLTRGSYTARYSKTGYVPRSHPLPIESDYQSGVIEMGLHRALAVQVINGRNNQPLQGAVVSVGTMSVTTDPQGFAYLNLPSGNYNVNVAPPSGSGLEPASISVEIPANLTSQVFRQVTLTPAGIRVRVVNPRNNRAPVDNASVTLLRPGQPVTVSTDSQGNAVFVYLDHNITPGTYEVEVFKRGYRRVRRGNIQVSDVNQSVSVEIEVPWTLLTVHVRDPQGQPVSGAIVRVIQDGRPIREGTTR